MAHSGDELAVGVVILVLLQGLVVGATNGALIVFSRVPDIVVTLAMSFVWAGAALLVLNTPGGASVK
jgi:ribose transport system permease protein